MTFQTAGGLHACRLKRVAFFRGMAGGNKSNLGNRGQQGRNPGKCILGWAVPAGGGEGAAGE